MKNYHQQTQSILTKARKKKLQKRAVFGSITALAATALALVLFLPLPTTQIYLPAHKNSAYYPVIEKLSTLTGTAWSGDNSVAVDESTAGANKTPTYKNNFEKWTAALANLFSPKFGATNDSLGIAPPTAPGNSSVDNDVVAPGVGEVVNPPNVDDGGAEGDGEPSAPGPEGAGPSGSTGTPDDNYEETTDNQVQGVIEADLLKRTKTHAFYLKNSSRNGWGMGFSAPWEHALGVYAIDGGNSREIATLTIAQEGKYILGSEVEMYLSMDGNTLTVISQGVTHERDEKDVSRTQYYTVLISVDVSDPATPKEINRVYLSGQYLSSRMVDGELLVINKFDVYKPDFEDESTFLPQYGNVNELQSVAAENIVCPQYALNARYTVVTKLDEKTLDVEDCVALLSYSNEVTVSATNLFLTQSYAVRKNAEDSLDYEQNVMTDITCVSYGDDGLQVAGTVSVCGRVKNQYSMDEYQNVLRVVTTTSRTTGTRIEHFHNGTVYSPEKTVTNASLYCIDLTDFSTVGKVEQFAPDNERVESVRFDGTNAYVCTAVVVTFKDPVFFFDLSDMNNITYTDTGTIDGYSSSLIQFGHGYLVGIGYGATSSRLKIEAYAEEDGKVISVASFEMTADFSEEYKSYFIDRENGYIGLGVNTYVYSERERTQAYLLLKFEDGKFVQSVLIPHKMELATARAFMEGEYLYLFGEEFQAIDLEAYVEDLGVRLMGKSATAWADRSTDETIVENALNQESLSGADAKATLPVYKCDSVEDLNAFKATFAGIFDVDNAWNEVPSFSDTTAGYDEAFFAENSILLVYADVSTCCMRYRVNEVRRKEDSLCVFMEQYIYYHPEYGFADGEGGWLIAIELPDSELNGVTDYDVVVI